MRRFVAGLFTLWVWVGAVVVVGGVVAGTPFQWWALALAIVGALALVRPPAFRGPALEVGCPLRGRWTVVHSPADRVPSHGVRGYGQAYAIDLIRPRPAGTPASYPLAGGFERPEAFASYGEPVLAVAAGRVVRVVSTRRDHLSRTSWLAFAYMMAIDGLRDLGGPSAVVGNHVVIDHGDDVYSLYAHLGRGSVEVSPGAEVRAGELLARVGNSGNTSEPHLHFQLMDRARPLRAAGRPFRFSGLVQAAGEIDPSWSRTPPAAEVVPGLPANYQVFEA